MKQILIAAFYYPPYADVAAMRASKFAKFLPEQGWQPWVFTISSTYYGKKIVNSSPEEKKLHKISRIPFLPLPAAKTILSLFFPFLLLSFLLLHRKRIDAVCIIGSPFHPFIITPILTSFLHLPTFLDFRDSWSHNYGFDGTTKEKAHLLTKAKKTIFLTIEKIALKYATCASFATSVLKDEYASLIPQYKEKFHVIYNGYDEDDFKNISPAKLSDKKTILLAGKFYLYTPEAVRLFFSWLNKIENLVFIYVGNEKKIIQSIAEEMKVEHKVIAMDYQPYSYVLQLIAGCNYCLLSNGLINGMGTKIFDYLALNKPTICFVPKHSILARKFARTEGIVIVETPHTYPTVKNGLNKLLHHTDISEDDRYKNIFSRRVQTANLARLLNRFSL